MICEEAIDRTPLIFRADILLVKWYNFLNKARYYCWNYIIKAMLLLVQGSAWSRSFSFRWFVLIRALQEIYSWSSVFDTLFLWAKMPTSVVWDTLKRAERCWNAAHLQPQAVATSSPPNPVHDRMSCIPPRVFSRQCFWRLFFDISSTSSGAF